MQSIKNQKQAHEQRMNVTEQDEKYYKEPVPLAEEIKQFTEEEKAMMWHEERLKQAIALEKRYADTCDKDERLW